MPLIRNIPEFLSMGVIELWCNGNTSLFGGGIIGSNPVSSTNHKMPLWRNR